MLKIFNKFSPRANPADSNYPNGSIKNETVPGAKDGTPLDADWGNDTLGGDEALLAEVSIVPSGISDTVLVSDRLNALKKLIIQESEPVFSTEFATFAALQVASAAGSLLGVNTATTIQHTSGFKGGAKYAKDGTTGTINTGDEGKFFDNNGDGFLLISRPSLQVFGGIADWNGTTGTDNAAAYLLYDAFCAANDLQQNYDGGSFFFGQMEIPLSVDMKGTKDTLLVFLPDVTEKNCIIQAVDTTIKRITFEPSVTDAVKTFFDNTHVADFSYHTKFNGPKINSDCSLIDVQALKCERGVRGTDGATRLSLVRGKYQGGEWGTSIFNCNTVTMTDVVVEGGTSGGMAMPSCQQVTVTGGYVYNPDGTGVNTGGAATAGFNVEDVTVVGVHIYARDCVNLENGCEGASIVSNFIDVISSSTSNGVGIGVHTRSGGGQVDHITCVANEISSSFGTYAQGIKIGDLDAGFDVIQVKIGQNDIDRATQGILFQAASAGKKGLKFDISGNNVTAITRALTLSGDMEDGIVSGGRLSRKSGTTVSATYGIEFGNLNKVQINGVVTKGWSPHLRQLGVNPVTMSKISEHTFFKNDDDANFVKLENLTGNPAISFTETV